MKASVVAACLAVLMCAGAASAGNMFGEEENFGVADVFNAYLAAYVLAVCPCARAVCCGRIPSALAHPRVFTARM